MNKFPFELPVPEGKKHLPQWIGPMFLVDDATEWVLEYGANLDGWSDDLTMLHEVSAGSRHPIDCHSREDAIRQLKIALEDRVDPKVVMEVGCSSGFLIEEIEKNVGNIFLIGADVVSGPLNSLAKRYPNTPFLRFDMMDCPLPSNSVDVLIMLNVLEHISDDTLALSQAFRILKPGGSLIVEVPAGKRLYGAYDRELKHFRRYSRSELKAKLLSTGFKIQRISHLGFLLFPAFALVKLMTRGRKYNIKDLVHKQAKITQESLLLKLISEIESRYFGLLNLPFGIRVLAVGKKVVSNE